MDIFTAIESASVACGLAYIVLLMRQSVWCWGFGILQSALYILSCFHAKIYLEAGLNFYYVVIGFYGWYLWARKTGDEKNKTLQITEWRAWAHIANILTCASLTVFLGWLEQKYTASPRPFFDAAITVFGFSATILEARKILSAWIYWFIINGATIVLMADRGMRQYAVLYALLTVLCIKGYLDWRKSKMMTC